MPDVLHDFLIRAPAARVSQAVSPPEHLDQWWTKRSAGQPTQGPRTSSGSDRNSTGERVPYEKRLDV
jgi:uncharacterized protein YndB with AHSA1/START domain